MLNPKDPDRSGEDLLALVNGAVGAVSIRDGEPFSIGSMIVRGGKIVEIDILARAEAATGGST